MGEARGSSVVGRVWGRLGPVGFAVALALGVRAVAAISEEVVFNDGPQFVRIAESFGRGDLRGALSHPFHPLTSALMAGLHAMTGLSLEAAGRTLSVLAGGAGAAALYALARMGWGPSVALSAALLFAVHPRMVDAGSSVQSDGLHVALVLTACVAAWTALSRHRPGAALGAGLLCGLAYLTRPEGLAVAVVFGAGLSAALLLRRVKAGRGLVLGALFAVGLVTVSGPYLLSLRDLSGSWTLTQKKSVMALLGADLLRGSSLRAPGELGDPTPQTPPVKLPGAAPSADLRGAVGEVARDGVRALHPLFLVCLLLGVRLRPPSAKSLYLLAFVGLFFFLLVGLRLEVGYVSRRHWLVGVAVLLPFAGRGLVEGLPALAAPWLSPPRLRALAWGAVAIVVLGLTLDVTVSREDPKKTARKHAALWLRQTEHVRALSAPRARDAYYAGARRWVPLPPSPEPGAFLRELRVRRAGFLLAEAASVPVPLREGSRELPLLHRVPFPEGEVLVFRVEKSAQRPDVAAGPSRPEPTRVEPRLPGGASGSPPPPP